MKLRHRSREAAVRVLERKSSLIVIHVTAAGRERNREWPVLERHIAVFRPVHGAFLQKSKVFPPRHFSGNVASSAREEHTHLRNFVVFDQHHDHGHMLLVNHGPEVAAR